MTKELPIDLGRLCTSLQASRLALRFPREARRRAVSHFAGSNWSEQNRERNPVNMLSLYTSIVGRNLIAKNPRVLLSTFNRSARPAVKAMERWLNKAIVDMNFAGTMRRVVTDALFSMGIAKCSLMAPAEAALSAFNIEAGKPYVQRIDLDDFVFDIHARDFSECSYIGHRIRVPLAAVMDDKRNYGRTRKDLTASSDSKFNQEGDERVSVLFRGYFGQDDDEIEDMVDLWEVYLARHKLVITIPDDCLTGAMSVGKGGEPEALRVQQWIGPYCGPYQILGFKLVPGNVMVGGTIQDLIDLHVPLNQIVRKLIDQACRQKDVTLFSRGQDGDAQRIRDSRDGELVPVDQPDKINPLSMGGPNPMLFQFFIQLKEIFSWMAGNLDIMGGLSPQAKTARQDAMLNENSSRGIQDMQDSTVAATSKLLESMGWYHWHDPVAVQKAHYSVPGLPSMTRVQEIHPWNAPAVADPRTGRAEMPLRRDARWDEIDVKVDPYSMTHSTPQQRANDLDALVKSVIIPMAQLLSSQGIQFDVNQYLEIMANYRDMPDLTSIITLRDPPVQEVGSSSGAGVQPAPETTTHVRQNMPGRTRQGNDMNMMNSLAGVNAGGSPNGQAKE